jgi:hypothetical protein
MSLFLPLHFYKRRYSVLVEAQEEEKMTAHHWRLRDSAIGCIFQIQLTSETMRDLPNAGIGQLVFHVDGEWKTRDVSGFLDSVDDSYNVLLATLAVSVLRRSAPTVRQALTTPVQVASTWFASGSAADGFVHAESATLRDAMREDMDAVFAHESLGISAMQTTPPARVAFNGLSEPLLQLRGLLRDLWSRIVLQRRTGQAAIDKVIHDHQRRVLELQAVEAFLKRTRGVSGNPPGSLPRDTLLLSSGLHQIAALIAGKRVRAMGDETAVDEFAHPVPAKPARPKRR